MAEISADILSMPERPALSATSDSPVVTEAPAETPNAEAPATEGDEAAAEASAAEGEAGEAGESGEETPPVTPAPKPKQTASERYSELAAARKLAEEQRAAADARADRLATLV